MKKHKIARNVISYALFCSMLILLLTACSKSGTVYQAEQDVLTNKPTEEDRIPLTIMCKFGINFGELEKAAEEKIPNLDLIIVNNYTFDSDVELKARMEAGDLTDIVTLLTPAVARPYYKEKMIDLSTVPFAQRYHISDLRELTDDGHLYLLPGPAQIRCLVYNKTAFQEMGLELPNTFDEFVDLCNKIEQHGVRSMRLALYHEIVGQSAFNGFGYQPCFATPADNQWQEEYNNCAPHSFYEHMKPAMDNFQILIDNGLIREEDLTYEASSRSMDLVERRYLITEDGPALISVVEEKSDDEFGLMPYFSGGEGSDWLEASSPIYFGLASHLAKEGNEEKQELALQVLDFISTEEGQETFFAANIGGISRVKFVPSAPQPGLDELKEVIDRGHYGDFQKLRADMQPALMEIVKQMILGERDTKKLAEKLDQENQLEVKDISEVIATAEKDFTYTDTGCLIADIMREKAGSDLALMADIGKDGNVNYIGVSAKLYAGDITKEDIARILPLYINSIERNLNVVTMTGQNVVDVLESIVEGSETFFYPSGLHIEYMPTAPFEERVTKVSNPDGTPFDLNKTYKVAIMGEAVLPEYYSGIIAGEDSVDDVVTDAIIDAKTVTPAKDKRFLVVK